MENKISVIDFYKGKSIFLTGGTGFIGKILIEKLLRTCKDIDKIYLLIRRIKSATPEERVRDLIEKSVFDNLRQSNPDVFNKLVPVNGDVSQDNLGIRREDESYFIDKVSVVIHSAAIVKFNERLDIVANLNYEGTKRVLNLCHRMNNLKSLVYVSTAYTNPNHDTLYERVYPPPTTDEKLKRFIEQQGMYDAKKLSDFLEKRPNTYTFTKAMAESFVVKNHGNIPTAIVRPSVVTASLKEPAPGFVDCWFASSTVLAATSLGYKRVLYGSKKHVIDFIPADFVSNAVIVAAAKCHSSKQLEIFNLCTSALNPLLIGDLNTISEKYMSENKFNKIPMPYVIMTKNEALLKVITFILERMPALLADLWLKVLGKKPRYVKLHSNFENQSDLVKYFTGKTWHMKADRTAELSRSLVAAERKQFYCNPQDICWKKYIPLYCRGICKYLLKK